MTWTPGARLGRIEAAIDQAARPGGALCPDMLLALDEDEAFPAAAAAFLDELEIHRLYVDRRNGGELDHLFVRPHPGRPAVECVQRVTC